ncbi:MAG: diaminopropionate ammonia-lyase [Pseudomonadota bacterium]
MGGGTAILSRDCIAQAQATICAWPEYRASPLLSAPGLAQMVDVGAVWIKDESERFGLGGVKALGAPYGLLMLLNDYGVRPGSDACGNYTAVAATDGNHGLALAWAAARFGCHARIYVGRDIDAGRAQRIRDAGAGIVIINGTYDDAVLAAERDAENPFVLLVTDTDYTGDLTVTRAIMAGYALLGIEAVRQLKDAGAQPSHVFLQCGVGGMAAGIATGLWQASGIKPAVVTVEATHAACIDASLRAGKPVSVPGSLATRMVGLSCGRPSKPAFDILRDLAVGSVIVDDDTAKQVQDTMMAGVNGDAPLATGDTGVAGIAGLWQAAMSPGLRRRLGLNRQSCVLVVNSEGPLPPQYA